MTIVEEIADFAIKAQRALEQLGAENQKLRTENQSLKEQLLNVQKLDKPREEK